MPHIGTVDQLSHEELQSAARRVYEALDGVSGEAAQAALLSVLFAVWEMNDVTKEQAKEVLLNWVDSHLSHHSN